LASAIGCAFVLEAEVFWGKMAKRSTKMPAVVVDKQEPHLGGNFSEGDTWSFCPSVWDYVIERFCVTSVLDLGSGVGNAACYFHSRGLKTVAIDGLAENVFQAFYPTIRHDLTLSAIQTRVDLVHCQEVVEHIEERYLDNVLSSLAVGRVILMTHGQPGQNGYHHVNLQSPEYWIRHVTSQGYLYLEEDSKRIRAKAAIEGARYMSETGLLFHRIPKG
jgi:SAM-dependent methyltransferase